MGLIGNMIDEAYGQSAATVNFCLFVSAFTLLTLFYLVPAALSPKFAIHPLLVLTVDILNTIFALCGAVALSSKLHARSCSNLVGDFWSLDPIESTSLHWM